MSLDSSPRVAYRLRPRLVSTAGSTRTPWTVPDFAGKIILLDFWTYTCVNCVRTLPFLQDWHEKYADHGLLIIGVHTPEFDFEKLHENVAAAVDDFGVGYAVAQDNERMTWNAYRVQAWPTKYIVDGNGWVRYYYRGEGAYADTELVIRYLLEEMGQDVSHIDPNTDPDPAYRLPALVPLTSKSS